ncbi:MAG: DUF6110 family protein [Lachnospiraceae bacterium]|jgi:hypothetical protein|nr:DUF6110 family protein [Lachnospiraceae bacterium]MEE3461968.1 DUF6110 family protein [Lachnospiraceae bacterium]
MNWSKFGLIAGGFLIGTLGLDILKSDDAKKCYTHVTLFIKEV